MSMLSPLGYQIPHETARVAQAAFPNGNLYMQMQAELAMIYTNSQFASLFSKTGQSAEEAARLALIVVMQELEGLPDRQAADAVRSLLDWKYALALELTDPGFDASVLSEFRLRLITGAIETELLDTLLTLLQQRGLLSARGYALAPIPRRSSPLSARLTGWNVSSRRCGTPSTDWQL